jgi:hypothetical protein
MLDNKELSKKELTREELINLAVSNNVKANQAKKGYEGAGAEPPKAITFSDQQEVGLNLRQLVGRKAAAAALDTNDERGLKAKEKNKQEMAARLLVTEDYNKNKGNRVDGTPPDLEQVKLDDSMRKLGLKKLKL